jgi:cell shape-determining protein MreC
MKSIGGLILSLLLVAATALAARPTTQRLEFIDQVQDDLVRLGQRITALEASQTKLGEPERSEFSILLRDIERRKQRADNLLGRLREYREGDWEKNKNKMRNQVSELEDKINLIETKHPKTIM